MYIHVHVIMCITSILYSLPPNFNPGFGMTLSNAITSYPLDDGGGSDEEDMHKRKLLQGSKQTAEAKLVDIMICPLYCTVDIHYMVV